MKISLKYSYKLQQIFSLLTCFLMLSAVAINQNQKLLGYKFAKTKINEKKPIKQELSDGTIVISTDELAKDVKGYGGSIPLEIYIKDGRITEIKALPNSETPDFFNKVKNSKVFTQWIGLDLKVAEKTQIDGISGATFSSNAVIENIRKGIEYAINNNVKATSSRYIDFSPKFVCTVLVILMASLLPLFIRSKRYRTVQLVLNTIVLGFWSGSFISYSLMVNYLTNGMNIWISIVPVLLLIVAFVFPLFGKKNHYCNWVCPLGSIQELAGKCTKNKWKLGPRLLKGLNYFHDGLWALLMLFMWSGVLFQWMDYEPFSAFIFRQASTAVLIIAIAIVLLSFFVSKPYCRFVCPTGTLIKLPQNNK